MQAIVKASFKREDKFNPTREFMESKGYRTLRVFYHGKKPFDFIFVHPSVKVDNDDTFIQELLKPKATWR